MSFHQRWQAIQAWTMWRTVLLIAIALWLSLSNIGGGLNAIFLAIIWLMATLCGFIWMLWKRSLMWKRWCTSLILWLITWMGIYAIHVARAEQAREAGNRLARYIEQYYQKNHHYPDNLPTDMNKPDGHYYWIHNKSPVLMYRSTIMPFDEYVYDFEKRVWVYRPD